MNYKKRMIDELIDLQTKITLLDRFLKEYGANIKDSTDKLRFDTMTWQLEAMRSYKNALLARLDLELN